MPIYDPELGLPVDENGNVLDPSVAGSDVVSEPFPWQTGEVPQRGLGGPAPQPPRGPQSINVGGGKVSGQFRGITERGKRQAAGVFGQADRRIAEFEADSAARADQEAAQAQDSFGALKQATEGEVTATDEFARRDQELQARLADFQRGAAELEQRVAGEVRAEREAFVSMYREQLAGVRALAAQTGNPIGGMSRAQMFGLAGAQFAQGFLAAQGVHIDVAGQVDRWVDRSIQEHQMRIQNARGAAQDTLHLYEIARQNSQDDWEARQRYRGFVIAGLQTSIQANASRFQSDIAMARAREQIARLQIDADATERSIADNHERRVHQFMTTEYDRAYKQGQLSIEQQQAAIQRDRLDWEKNKAAKEAEAAAGNLNFTDPEALIGEDGKPVVDAQGNPVFANKWRVDPTIPDAIKKEVFSKADEARTNYDKYLGSTNKMTAAYTEAKKIYDKTPNKYKVLGWDAVARADSTGKVAEFIQLRRQWVIDKVLNDSGKAATDVERKQQEALAYLDQLIARNGNKGEKLYAQLRENGREKFEAHMRGAGLKQIAENDPERYEVKQGASPRTKAEDQAILTGEQALEGFAAVQAGRAAAPQSDDIKTKQMSGSWRDFQREQLGQNPDRKAKNGQPEYAVVIDRLASAYARPGFFSKNSNAFGVKAEKLESPAEVRAEAYEALKRLSLGESDGGAVPADAQDYAGYVLRQIDNDPSLRNLDHDEDIREAKYIEKLTERVEGEFSWAE